VGTEAILRPSKTMGNLTVKGATDKRGLKAIIRRIWLWFVIRSKNGCDLMMLKINQTLMTTIRSTNALIFWLFLRKKVKMRPCFL
jgi:hypothetical protein